MTTRQERIEKAAQAMVGEDDWGLFIELANEILDAAYPELSGDKPSHWLAPMEPTKEMGQAAWDLFHTEYEGEIYAAMRDAYNDKDKTDE